MAEPSEPPADKGTGEEVTEPQLPDVAGTMSFKLNDDDLSTVLDEVYEAHGQWYYIGLQLGLVSSVLEGIKKQHSRTQDKLCEMLKCWLKQVSPMPTWAALIEALKNKTVSEPSLAEQLEKRHILPLPQRILTHSVSNITDRHKQFLGQLQVTTKQYDSQLESFEELLQQSEKVNPSDDTPEAAQKRQVQRGESEPTPGLKSEPERALHMQLKQLMGRISSLEEKMTGAPVSSQSSRVPGEPVIKELDPLSIRNSELEEELGCLKEKLREVKAKNVLLTKELEDLKKEKISIVSEKDEEFALKARDLANKSKDYELLHDEMQQLQKQLKSQISDESHALPDTAGSTETAPVDQ